MVSNDDILNLANLARIEVREDEVEKFRSKMEGVLAYVSEVQGILMNDEISSEVPVLHNVFREDGEPHAPGFYTEAILKNAPEKASGYIKVRKIL